MNMVSENTINSAPLNHSIKCNNKPKTENIKESNFKNFENHKVGINQKREQCSINHQRKSSQKHDQLFSIHNKFQEDKNYIPANTNIILDINGKDVLENDDRNGESLFYNENDIQEDRELLDLFLINKDLENKHIKELKGVQNNNPALYQPNNTTSPSNLNNNLKQQKNIFNFKKMDIEMIPEEDEERLKTEYETGRKFYDNQPERKQESLTDKVRENQVKKRLMINSNPIKKNLESVMSNAQKGESENKNINFIIFNEPANSNKGFTNNKNHKRNMKLDDFVKSITPKGDFCNTDLNNQSARRINYNDILSVNNLNGIHNLYPYNYSININSTSNFERNDNSKGENLKKSNSELFEKENQSKFKSFSKYDRQTINNKDQDNTNKKMNLYYSKSVNFDNKELNLRGDICQKTDKEYILKEKEENKVLRISNDNTNVQTNKILVDSKNVSIFNNKSGKLNKSANLAIIYNKNNNNSYPEIIKFDNNDKIDFENSFDQISEISIKNNSTINTNYNMSPDKEKTLNESIVINKNSKEKILDNNFNQENIDLKSLIDFINKKQIQHTKSLSNIRLKDETKGNISKNSSINIYNQNNSNNSNSAYSKRNAIINSKNIDSVDTDVSIIHQQFDLNNKSKLSIKQIKDFKNKDSNQSNIPKISKIIINDEVSNKEVNLTNKVNTIYKNNNSNCSQNEIINGYANNNSIYNNEKSLSSIFQSKVRVKSYLISQTRLNLLDKGNNDSFISNNDCLNINNKYNENKTNKINESQDVLNNNFDFNELQTEEHENTKFKFIKGKGKISDFDLLSIKFPIFTCESTKNKHNNSNLFNGNMNFDKVKKDMKLPLINNSLNKSVNINNLDLAENKNSVNNTRINNLNNSIFKDKSFFRNLKNNSSLLSNKFDFNVNSNFDEESNDPLEKEKFLSFRSNNIKEIKTNLNNASGQNLEERNKITSAPINEKNIIDKNLIQEREIHSNEGKIKFLNPLKNKVNTLNKNNNVIESQHNLKIGKVNFISYSNVNNKNGLILKKDNDNDKKSQPIKLFYMNLNKVIES